MTVYLGEILTNYKKPKNCYGFQATHDLFFAIKTKNFKLTNIILDKYKYIVLDYDYFEMTALHWAAKYNFYQIIPKIIEYGSLVDNKNYIGDTPLLVSVKHKFMVNLWKVQFSFVKFGITFHTREQRIKLFRLL